VVWGSVLCACALSGSLLARLAGVTGVLLRLRVGLWLGIGMLLAFFVLVNLRLPLTGPVWWPVWLTTAIGAIVLAVDLRRRPRGGAGGRGDRRWVPPAAVGLSIVVVASALTALGRVTNYDSGLYHWPLIDYAAAYPAIPGLANLSPWFGYASAIFPLGAAIGALVESAEGARLVNGMFFSALALDVLLRMASVRRRLSAGDIAAVAGLGIAFAGLGLSSDYASSPSPDTAPLVLLIVATAAALDSLTSRRQALPDLIVAVVAGASAAAIRVQLWPLVAAMMLVLFLTWWSQRSRPSGSGRPVPTLAIAGGVAGLLLIAQLTRDTVLTGWWLYPATVVKAGGDWALSRAAVEATSQVVGDFARTLGGALYQPEAGPVSPWWAWSARNLTDVGLVGLVGLLAAAGLLLWYRRGIHPRPPRSRPSAPTLGLVSLAGIFAASIVLSFILAPNPRYAWGVLIGLGLIAFASQAWALGSPLGPRPRIDTAGALAWTLAAFLLLPSLLTVVGRQGAPEVLGATNRLVLTLGPLRAAPLVPDPDVSQQPSALPYQLRDGTIILRPEQGDQCWRVFPLCLGSEPPAGLILRGAEISDGFRVAPE